MNIAADDTERSAWCVWAVALKLYVSIEILVGVIGEFSEEAVPLDSGSSSSSLDTIPPRKYRLSFKKISQ